MGCSSDCSCCKVDTSGDNSSQNHREERSSVNHIPIGESKTIENNDIINSSQNHREESSSDNHIPVGESITIEKNNIIMSQLIKCVCKIYQTKENTGTGFMCEIPYKNQLLPVLITNNHVLNEKMIKKGKTIKITFNNKKEKKYIKIDNSRKIYTNPYKDITIIEIKKEEDKINDFLDIDDTRTENEYQNEAVYTLQYQSKCKASYNTGKIKSITEGNIIHNCDTDEGSSGSPIISLNNNKVIGLHFGKKNEKMKFGIFIKNIIEEFKKNKKYINKEGDYYEGKWLNELKNGMGIIYYKNGDIKYIGNFENDYLLGFIKYFYKNGNCYNCYLGESKNQLQNGKGIIKDKNKKIVYKGFFEEGKIKGFGIYFDEDSVYEGEWENNKRQGFGIIYYKCNDTKRENKKYYGTFVNGQYDGYGIEFYPNGQRLYKGEYKNGKKDGEGEEFDDKGKGSYKGKYCNGEKINGTEYYNDGKTPKYIGNYKNGKYDGKGTFYEEDGTCYEGYFLNGKKHGDGKVLDKNGTILKGVHYENGEEK